MIHLILALISFTCSAEAAPWKWAFVGDILLGRQVERELQLRPGISPWQGAPFISDETVLGNFEGAIGTTEQCVPKGELTRQLCFAIDERRLPLLREAGFNYLSLENNHAHDTGSDAPTRSAKALDQAGLAALTFGTSPVFVRKNGIGIALVAVDLVSKGHPELPEIERKIRLAKRLAHWTVVVVHWGTELLGWPDYRQTNYASGLVAAGADIIVGSHPHVIQDVECIDEHPVYYSLGNHLFDQRYPSTHTGQIVRCAIELDSFSCERFKSIRDKGSTFPRVSEEKIAPLSCESKVRKSPREINRWEADTVLGGIQLIRMDHRLERQKIKPFSLLGFADFHPDPVTQGIFLTHRAFSDFDRKIAIRPAVYAWKDGALQALWKGSALAFPIEDADVTSDDRGDFICALHGPTVHFSDKPVPENMRIMPYYWNGFGFTRDSDPRRLERCVKWASAFRPQT